MRDLREDLLKSGHHILSGRIRPKTMSGLEMCGRRKTERAVGFRRLVIRRTCGIEPHA
jgi:hypothetical protein